MARNWAFTDPFPVNGCVPCAFAHLTGTGAAGARRIAARAARTAAPSRVHALRDRKLYNLRSGSGWASRPSDVRAWAKLAGLAVRETWDWWQEWTQAQIQAHKTGACLSRTLHRPTVARFAREHPVGRWVVYTRDHAIALVDGVLYGFYQPRSRVHWAYRFDGGMPCAT